MCPCFTMHHSYAMFRAMLKMFPTLDTIYEIEENEKEWEVAWDHWLQAKDDGWGQWADIDDLMPRPKFKCIEPSSPPPPIR